MKYDVIIIGAGPAGCLASIGIKQKDKSLNVLIIEKNEISTPRVGEALLTGTIYTLEQANVLDDILKKYDWQRKIGASYLWGNNKTKPWYVNYELTEDYPPQMINKLNQPLALHVIRHKFDEALKEIAISKGVDIAYGEPSDFKFVNDALFKTTIKDKQYSAKYWIDATGQAAIFANNNNERTQLKLNRTSKYFYTDSVDWIEAQKNGYAQNRTNILSCKDGWLWFIHLGIENGKDITSIGFVGQANKVKTLTKENIIETFKEFKNFGLSNNVNFYDAYAKNLEELYYHPEYTYISKRLSGDNWALVGDAALFLDPILSQGVTLASHYGLMHGYAAAAFILGDKEAPKRVVNHYLKEAEVLKEVINFWYEKNYSKKDWQEITHNIVSEFKSKEGLEDSFRYITNLENLKEEYHPFSIEQQSLIEENMK